MKKIFRLGLTGAIVSAAALTACQTAKVADHPAQKASAEPSADSNLTWQEAKWRAQKIRKVTYDLGIKLNATDETFRGRSEIRFEATDTATPLRLDLFEGEVTALSVNGAPIATTAKKQFWIEIPAAALKTGDNVVNVEYVQRYSRQGQGLHRFKDPETGEVFLWTQFETFDANRFMPCFDQPDLKATLTLTVEAPLKWEVISTSPEASITKVGANRVWKFEKTPTISTYLFSLHAGPYKVWRDRFENIPLRLFARPSMAKYVRAQEWFTVTKQGLRFYNHFFNLPYPFRKYDQLYVPEFNAGAMENVGAVTFSEKFLHRSEPTREQRRHSASVLLHEMAHMWFGDIVTMKWWNDLWLNESFATIMAALSLQEATEFKDSWQDFFADDKTWAYWEDSLVTTHPIESRVASVKEAFATFDGITYGKGASVIKQLRAYIGPDAFRAGVRDYFQQHAFHNAELEDFVGALQRHTDRDLTDWAWRWLRQSGTDTITAKWTCSGANLNEVELITTPAPDRKFRPQTVQLALFKLNGSALKNLAPIRVEVKSERQTVKGPWPCPDFVYPNHRDDGYLSVSLDPKTLSFVKANLSRIPDAFVRTMLWYDLWLMVRNTEMPLHDYVQIMDRHFGPEKDTILLTKIVSRISGRSSILQYWPTGVGADEELAKFIARIEKDFFSRFQAAKPGSDAQKFWFDQYIGIARSPEALNGLSKWVDQPKAGPGFPLDPDRRWSLLTQLARFQHKDVQRHLATMKAKDRSDRGQREALAVEAIQPDPLVKQKWVGLLSQPKPPLPFADARVVLHALFPLEQASLAKRFENDFYSYLAKNGANEDEIYVEAFAERAAPLDCEGQGSSRMKSFLNEGARFSPSVAKTLKISLEEDERCQRVRAKASGHLQSRRSPAMQRARNRSVMRAQMSTVCG